MAAAPRQAMPRLIHEPVAYWAESRPDAAAFIDHDGRGFSWRETQDAVEAAARMLRDHGVGTGDRVLIVLENCVAAAAFILAASLIGAWAVPINARLAAPEVNSIHTDCEPRLAVFTDAVSADAARHADRFGAGVSLRRSFGAVRIAGPFPTTPEPVEGAPVAAVLYTSGTMGKPKGVMLSHANLLYIATVSGAIRALASSDLVYAVLPVSHVFGLSSTFLGTLYAGGSLQLVPRFDPAALAAALAGGVTVFQGVPAMYAKLLEYLDARGEPLIAPKLRYMSAGGAPLDIAWKRKVEACFGIALNNGYGLTEASPTVSQTRIDAPREDDSIGPPLPQLDIRIVNGDGIDMPQGEVGELWVGGPNVMRGYFRDPAATAATITPDGWLRTGDLARQDADGNLFLVGRVKELIIRSGFNVYPPEVETALNAHPGVVQSAVVGRRIDGNEEIVAFVEAAPDAELRPHDLADFLSARLAPYKRPQHIFIVGQMPASATGKVQKHTLAALAETLIAEAK
jgi:long-chain acyl-CoA synthetase